MPKPYPQEFHDDVVRVARNRPDGWTSTATPAWPSLLRIARWAGWPAPDGTF